MNIALTQNIAGLYSQDVEDLVTNELELTSGLELSLYTNVMYVLPGEVNFSGAAAYAYLNGRLSVVSNLHVSIQHVLIHEIGHNFGHHHSGRGNSEYGDETGMT